jgi:hypothetical protein
MTIHDTKTTVKSKLSCRDEMIRSMTVKLMEPNMRGLGGTLPYGKLQVS